MCNLAVVRVAPRGAPFSHRLDFFHRQKKSTFSNDSGYTNFAYEHVAHSETEHLAEAATPNHA